MQSKQYGNEYRTTVVCVDAYQKGKMSGHLQNPYLPSGETFESVMDFLRKMESLLDSMQFPQSFTAARAFSKQPEPEEKPPVSDAQRGTCGTFAIRVLFRQNASWQGSVTWLEESREETFRSALELLFLMDSALASLDTEPGD